MGDWDHGLESEMNYSVCPFLIPSSSYDMCVIGMAVRGSGVI